MIKHGQDSLIRPLLKLFNLVLNSGYYPHEWSKGRIVSLHKKGDPTLALKLDQVGRSRPYMAPTYISIHAKAAT